MNSTQDYYADLDLPPDADVTDIKKQYRKLALKYHPDRNPGREQEVNSKFLIIQAAHDILTDPQKKAKYDATRTRSGAGRYASSSGVKGNPWSDLSQQYPVPPRRRNDHAPRTNPSRGAERWNTRFSAGVPPTSKQNASDAEAKKNFATAFEQMRNNKAQAGNKSNQGASRTSGPPPPTPPRSESARRRAENAFGTSSTRKTGYHPRGATDGDEPPVTSRNYSSRPDNHRFETESFGTQAPMEDPLRQFRDDSQAENRHRAPYTTHGGEKTNLFDGLNISRSKSMREAVRPQAASNGSFSPDKPPSGNASDSATASKPQGAKAGKKTIGAYSQYGVLTPFEQKQRQLLDQLIRNSGTSLLPKPRLRASTTNGLHRNMKGANLCSNSFNLSDDETGKFARSSTDDINTTFVNDDGKTPWQFGAASTNQQNQNGGDKTPSKSAAANSSSAPKAGQASQPQTAFDANTWGDQFGPHTFEPQTRSTSVSPTKASRANSKKTRQPKSQPDVITIEDSSDEEVFSWTGRKTQANPAAVDSPQAMDIDPPQEPVVEQAPVHEARNIPVEPSRPEWRPGDFGARAGSAGSKKSPETTVNANAAGSEDSEEFKASLADLSKVAPFAQQASGLKSFKDMKDHLPFESKASDEVFDKGDKDITRLAFPQIPVAPRPSPSFAVEGIKPTASAWQKYAAEFETYLRQWSEFNSSVIDHFEARRSNLVASRAANGYDFLRARGDEGCAEYLKAVSQDNDVRRRWNEACENHEERLREFMTFRAKMK
uniref:J domain-containing protein n=1 Tax=Bionectria ochroleuca TaxID=29856 RepID=A0A0B7JHE3_BIOOC